MPKLTVQQIELKDPIWGAAAAIPGTEIELSATAEVSAEQWLEFRINTDDPANGVFDVVVGKKGEKKAKWTPPACKDNFNLTFDALLREKPTAKNGHRGILLKATSPTIALQGYTVEMVSVDECFVPKQEKLELKYKVTDPGASAKKGRIVVWGERYPKDEYLFSENFDPANGDKTWDTWDGKANNGYLKDKYISPEFSPYRIQVIIGPDQDSIDKPTEKGIGKIVLAEKQFEIKFFKVIVRYAANLDGAVTTALKPDETLVIEPRTPKGAYCKKGRTPLEKEEKVDAGWGGNGEGAEAAKDRPGIGRIRIQGGRHTIIGEGLNQASSNNGDPANIGGRVWLHRIANPYMADNENPPDGPGGAGEIKQAIDKTLYKRPEIPLEIEARLKSRKPDEEANKEGLFEKEAIGPARYDVFAQDPYQRWYYEIAGTPLFTLYDEARTYFKKCAWKVKRGEHDAPYNDGANPVITYWQERFEISADGQEEVGDTEEAFVKDKKELTVYLNGVRLERDDEATTDNAKRIKKDYAEISTKKIKLRKGLTRDKDEVWIVREPNASLNHPIVTRWKNYPPGDNCHEVYGGVRGIVPTDDLIFTLRKDFSGTLAGKFKYTAMKTIDLDPYKVDADKRERVISQAATVDGDQKGLAGIIFSPSTIAGDKYVVEATLTECPYERDLGFTAPKPVSWNTKGKTGTMYVWRLLTLKESWRMPLTATGGLAAGVGEGDPAAAGRTHPMDGRKMNFLGLNTQSEKGFTEWVALKAGGTVAAPNDEAHQNVNLDNYRGYFNGMSTADGFYNIAGSNKVTNEFIRWDYFRKYLPPGIPQTRKGVASWTVNQVFPDKGPDPVDVAIEVNSQITDWNTNNGGPGGGDAGPGGTAITIPNNTPDEYFGWIDGKCTKLANEYMDQLIAQEASPLTMRVLRWPKMFWDRVWYDGTPGAPQAKGLGVAGYCRGSGQAFFFSEAGNPDTFEHEMGHSLHLMHFAAGGETNFGWKQHDHNYVHCLMGYSSGSFTVPLKTVKVGASINIATNPRNHLCPKCLMKIRGWREDILPCNWTHPDVF